MQLLEGTLRLAAWPSAGRALESAAPRGRRGVAKSTEGRSRAEPSGGTVGITVPERCPIQQHEVVHALSTLTTPYSCSAPLHNYHPGNYVARISPA